ncbi:MAG: fatty-acid--CoA ligase [Acidimicrobiales bacterium]|nr:fatty-acid--CoA ligase [Acidimicrobiales bacterium]
MELQFATVWESIADRLGDQAAIVHGDVRRSWTEYDERSARIAAAFVAAGLGPSSKIGLYMYNGNEYLEAQYAGFKMRGVPINVNYRYLDEELWYLLDNSDSEGIVFHSSLGERVARVLPRLPKLKLLIEVDDGGPLGQVPGSMNYDALIAETDPMPRITRAEDDLYMLYTGGTTGMPKGVMYAQGGQTGGLVQSSFPLLGVAPPTDASLIAGLVADAIAKGNLAISIPACPLMHGTGMWLGAMAPLLMGGTVITLQARSLDSDELLRVLQTERATNLVIVGDSFAKPIVHALDHATEAGTPYDTSSLKIIVSSGVMWTSEVKEQLLERIPQTMLLDAMGSTEGTMGMQISMRGMPAETAKFSSVPTTKVFTDDDQEVQPGSGQVGMVAAGGNVPLGYYKDEEKSARTFRVINGLRYSFPGDMARVNADGSLELLGRGSQVINTAGEKVFPEEVEEAVKRYAGILDCLVVGIEDDKFGQAVTAVASKEDDASVTEAAVIASVKGELAGYKAPKRVIFVDDVPRAPNGKADYKAAKRLALEGLGRS